MTHPIDTAYVEIKPEFDRFAAQLKNELDRALKGLKTHVDSSLKDVDTSFKRASACGAIVVLGRPPTLTSGSG